MKFLWPFLYCAAWAADSAPVYNVHSYGTTGDGKTSDTAAIHKTIDAAAAAGGGVVYLPTGAFLSGTIFLKSNVTLDLAPGAVLLGSGRIQDYSPKHLIYARNVENVTIEAGDDCIVLKTTNRQGSIGPTENVTVTNCVLVSSAAALKLGTESWGDFRHIVFSNCVIRDSRTGIALLAKDGGTMEDIRFSNIVMTTRPKWGSGVEWPIVVDIEKRNEKSKLSHIRDIAFTAFRSTARGACWRRGRPKARSKTFCSATCRCA